MYTAPNFPHSQEHLANTDLMGINRGVVTDQLAAAALSIVSPQSSQEHRDLPLEVWQQERIKELEIANQELLYLATHDEMTNALNRRGIVEKFNTEARTGMIMVAADFVNFKAINAIPKIGFAIGDNAIKKLVDICESQVRPGDYVSRPSGDEVIMLIMPTRLYRPRTARMHFSENKVNLLERFRAPVHDELVVPGVSGMKKPSSFWEEYAGSKPELGVSVSFGAALWCA